MTYSHSSPITAATAINEWGEGSLADIIYGFGEERYARRIAKAIVERRAQKPFTTSRELAEHIAESVPAGYRRGRIHPATRTFQALRIAVNDEFGAITQGLAATLDLLAGGGRIAVITFHSLEDRIVKRFFVQSEKEGKGKRITKKPLTPSREEIKGNRRARSAKLRVFEKDHDEKTTQNKQIQTLDPTGKI
jgi:16S rRNA (cytosine1402-N4)-methyltransferase